MPDHCPSCSTGTLLPQGFGTEKVEEELHRFFPAARIERLDADSARSTRNYRRIIDSFSAGTTDILIGTQIITKGFDFGGVALVGILNADNLLLYPDFRSSERAFQLIVQVGGRAGRRDEQGTVIIQTTQPDHPVIRQALNGDYETMIRTLLAERQTFLYPPLLSIDLHHFSTSGPQSAPTSRRHLCDSSPTPLRTHADGTRISPRRPHPQPVQASISAENRPPPSSRQAGVVYPLRRIACRSVVSYRRDHPRRRPSVKNGCTPAPWHPNCSSIGVPSDQLHIHVCVKDSGRIRILENILPAMKTAIEMYVIQRVKEIRIRKGLSQAALADCLNLSKGFIGDVENPKSRGQIQPQPPERNCQDLQLFDKRPATGTTAVKQETLDATWI